MRYALRNKGRLIESFGCDLCNRLIECLNVYFSINEKIERFNKDGYTQDFINVPGGDCSYCFAIVGEQYDVLTLAYFPLTK